MNVNSDLDLLHIAKGINKNLQDKGSYKDVYLDKYSGDIWLDNHSSSCNSNKSYACDRICRIDLSKKDLSGQVLPITLAEFRQRITGHTDSYTFEYSALRNVSIVDATANLIFDNDITIQFISPIRNATRYDQPTYMSPIYNYFAGFIDQFCVFNPLKYQHVEIELGATLEQIIQAIINHSTKTGIFSNSPDLSILADTLLTQDMYIL